MGLIGNGVEGLLDARMRLGGALEEEVADGEVIDLGIDEAAVGIIG